MRLLFILLQILALTFLQSCTSVQDDISSFFINFEIKRAGLVVQTVKVKDYDIAYLEKKGAGPVIVLLHGFSSDKNDWVRFVRYLPEKYRIIALDLPGHGENVQTRLERYDPSSLSHGIADIINSLGIDRFHLVGNSLGGLVSKLYVLEHPEKIISLGLFDSAGVTPPVPGDFYEALEKGNNPFDIKTKADWEVLKTYAFFDPPFIPWPMDNVMVNKRILKNTFYQKMFKAVTEHPALTDPQFQVNMLQSLSMPVLVIWGDKDRILNVSSVEVYSKYVKNLQTFIFKDCGHVPMIERPKETARHYAQFISKY